MISIRKLLFIIILIILLPAIYLLSPTSLNDEKIRFVIPVDTKKDAIMDMLKKDNFIRSKSFFSLILGMQSLTKDIDAGSYLLSHRMTPLQIADTLLNHPYQRWVTIIPGLRKEQIAEKVGKKLLWDDTKIKEFVSIADEGYLFPDTYLINADYTPREVVQKFLVNFNEKFDRKIQKDLLAQNIRNDTAIKIASIIERESGTLEDKPLIAGIIWNRLDKKMPLQLDATIQYAIGKSDNWWPVVKGSDLKIDSDYNTYLNKGLPPYPISSPSLASIKAVVYPEDTECLFYLHSPDMKIHCAKTYEEHLENIKKYLD